MILLVLLTISLILNLHFHVPINLKNLGVKKEDLNDITEVIKDNEINKKIQDNKVNISEKKRNYNHKRESQISQKKS